MWSDNDIDNAFQRLNPPEPEPTPFPLDAWLRLETQLDKAVIERAVRQKLLRFFAAEVVIVALVALGWLLWPVGTAAPAAKEKEAATAATGARTTLATASPIEPVNHAKNIPAVVKTAVSPASSAAPATGAATPGAVVTAAAPAPVATTEALAPDKHAAAPRLLAAIIPDIRRKHPAAKEHPAESRAVAAALAAGGNSSTASHTRTRLYQATDETKAAGTSRLATTAAAVNAGALSASNAASHGALAHGKPYSAEVRTAALGRRTAGRSRNQEREVAAKTAANSSATSKSATISAENNVAATDFAAPALRAVALAPADATALPTPLATVAVAETPAKAEVPTPVRQPRFYVGLVAAPDVTTVKFASVESPLPNLGITLEYRLTSRLRVSTGVLRAKKQYMARRDDYDWGTYKTMVYRHDFEDVDGTCTVLDIPLNLRYDLLSRPTYNLFGSIGLSSFFMQRERYTYDYWENNMSKVWDGGDIINQNRHLLSLLNLSVGYERRLSSHWRLQAEPYYKLPLGGVGAGKVKLTSAGVFLGVKYGF
ncbi:hypothetical protein [Hymenobacter terricola]|uniref:hypothetical protein n=1 Tax=Hymenobacter terricola TaxID=2819236 RepID=UPI001B3076A2|nr:hypothetical protein [Hymenobacter terricola]